MNIEDVRNYVQQHVPFTYYINEFPNSSSDCGFVRFNDGQPPNIYIVGLKTPSIQFGIRHKNLREAERIAKKIWELFHGKSHYYIGSTFIYVSYCDQSESIYVGKDENGRANYSVNVTCKIRE